MLTTQRVIHAATDISVKVNEFRAVNYTFAYTAGQYLYVGSEMPFNHLHFELASGGANAVASAASVALWWNTAWVAAVDVVDQTTDAAGGTKSLAQSGRITWTCNIDSGWSQAVKASDVTGLSAFNIYELYWARLAWVSSLTSTTALSYIGQKFAADTDLFGYYPDLNNTTMMGRFRSGKTDWNEQHFMAAERIARDLIARKLIFSRSQIFDCGRLLEAGVHKAAQLIYAGLGQGFAANFAAASKAYEAAMNSDNFRLSRSERLTESDKAHSTTFGTR